MSRQQPNHNVSEEDFQDTIAQLKRLKLTSLKDVSRSLSLPLTGRKADLYERIEFELHQGKNQNDQIKLISIRTLILKSLNGVVNLPSYTILSAALISGSYNEDAPNQYSHNSSVSRRTTMSGHSAGGSATIHKNLGSYVGPKSQPFKGHQLYFKQSPFYKLKRMIHGSPILALEAKETRGTADLQFLLSEQERELLSKSNHSLFLLSGVINKNTSSTSDALLEFPHPIEIHFNSEMVKDNVKGIKNKPGTSRPANLTPFLKFPPKSNNLHVVYAFTKDSYLFYLYIVESVLPSQLMKSIAEKPHIIKQATLKQIQKDFEDDEDDEIMEVSSTLDLKCPLTFGRMTYPCKSIYCQHLQCFDGLAFLQLQEQVPTWNCPICAKIIDVKDLCISDYIKEILDNTGEDDELVEIDPSGHWTVKSEDVDKKPELKTKEESVSVSLTGEPISKAVDIEIISLDSESDEEDVNDNIPMSQLRSSKHVFQQPLNAFDNNEHHTISDTVSVENQSINTKINDKEDQQPNSKSDVSGSETLSASPVPVNPIRPLTASSPQNHNSSQHHQQALELQPQYQNMPSSLNDDQVQLQTVNPIVAIRGSSTLLPNSSMQQLQSPPPNDTASKKSPMGTTYPLVDSPPHNNFVTNVTPEGTSANGYPPAGDQVAQNNRDHSRSVYSGSLSPTHNDQLGDHPGSHISSQLVESGEPQIDASVVASVETRGPNITFSADHRDVSMNDAFVDTSVHLPHEEVQNFFTNVNEPIRQFGDVGTMRIITGNAINKASIDIQSENNMQDVSNTSETPIQVPTVSNSTFLHNYIRTTSNVLFDSSYAPNIASMASGDPETLPQQSANLRIVPAQTTNATHRSSPDVPHDRDSSEFRDSEYNIYDQIIRDESGLNVTLASTQSLGQKNSKTKSDQSLLSQQNPIPANSRALKHSGQSLPSTSPRRGFAPINPTIDDMRHQPNQPGLTSKFPSPYQSARTQEFDKVSRNGFPSQSSDGAPLNSPSIFDRHIPSQYLDDDVSRYIYNQQFRRTSQPQQLSSHERQQVRPQVQVAQQDKSITSQHHNTQPQNGRYSSVEFHHSSDNSHHNHQESQPIYTQESHLNGAKTIDQSDTLNGTASNVTPTRSNSSQNTGPTIGVFDRYLETSEGDVVKSTNIHSSTQQADSFVRSIPTGNLAPGVILGTVIGVSSVSRIQPHETIPVQSEQAFGDVSRNFLGPRGRNDQSDSPETAISGTHSPDSARTNQYSQALGATANIAVNSENDISRANISTSEGAPTITNILEINPRDRIVSMNTTSSDDHGHFIQEQPKIPSWSERSLIQRREGRNYSPSPFAKFSTPTALNLASEFTNPGSTNNNGTQKSSSPDVSISGLLGISIRSSILNGKKPKPPSNILPVSSVTAIRKTSSDNGYIPPAHNSAITNEQQISPSSPQAGPRTPVSNINYQSTATNSSVSNINLTTHTNTGNGTNNFNNADTTSTGTKRIYDVIDLTISDDDEPRVKR